MPLVRARVLTPLLAKVSAREADQGLAPLRTRAVEPTLEAELDLALESARAPLTEAEIAMVVALPPTRARKQAQLEFCVYIA